MANIVCLRWFTFDVFNYKLLSTMFNYVSQFFQNQGSFPHALSLKRIR